MRRRYFLLLGMRRNRTSPMTSTKGDQTMRKSKENVKEIAQPSRQLIKEKPAYESVAMARWGFVTDQSRMSAMYFSNMRHQSGGPKEPK
jgi:hypothetical protein